ncbi:hypothetical protein ACU4GD_21380 [Cupriavidus basilensis]
MKENGIVRRLHIVDACQALDLPVSYKYERNLRRRQGRCGDPRRRQLRTVVFIARENGQPGRRPAHHAAVGNFPVPDRQNSDAHGKNFSFFCTRAGLDARALLRPGLRGPVRSVPA